MINGISTYSSNYQLPEPAPRAAVESDAPRFPEEDTVEISSQSQEASPAPIGPGTFDPPDPGNG